MDKSSARIKKVLEKWAKNKLKNYYDVTSRDNIIIIRIDSQEIKIIVPENYPLKDNENLLVEYDDLKANFTWLSNLNNYILDTNPGIMRLLKHIDKEYKNSKVEQITNLDEHDMVIQFDIDEMKMRKKLEDNIKNMKSSLSIDVPQKKANIFTDNIIPKILINEYLNIKRLYKNNEAINIELYNESIYDWKITFNKFSNDVLNKQLSDLRNKYGYGYIELCVSFHEKLYPVYPPFLKVMRPRLKNNQMYSITNLKMVQFEYWTPSRNMQYVIEKLYEVLDKNAEIEVENELNDINKYNNAYHEIETVLVKLASFCDVKNDIQMDKTEYQKTNNKSKSVNDNQNSTYWKAGTGYGHSASSKWNIDEYIELQKEKDVQIQSILQKIIDEVQNTVDSNIHYMKQLLESSHLIPFIISYLNETTLMEICKHKNIYKLIFTLLQNFITDETVSLFSLKDRDGRSIYELLENICSDTNKVMKFKSKTTEINNLEVNEEEELDTEMANMLLMLYEMVKPIYQNYIEIEKANKVDNAIAIDKDSSCNEKRYLNELEALKFDMIEEGIKDFRYKTEKGMNSIVANHLAKEFGILMKSLPITYQSSIFVRADENCIKCLRVLITGTSDTPYDSGVFIFDLFAGDDYPDGPPQMVFLNTGGKRFNPNLYNNGKVCLSLLGTWRGQAAESWNKNTSTLQQLLVSVQSQILTDQPYFNEPGWESNYGKEPGITQSKIYNCYTRYYTMCYAMLDILLNMDKFPEFIDVITKHFMIKKQYILTTCKQWVEEAQTHNKGPQQEGLISKEVYLETYKKLEERLNSMG